MAVWSCLRNIGKLNTFGSTLTSLKNVSKTKAVHYVPVRTSHDRTIVIRPSLFPLMKMKDLVILYLMLGSIPLVLLATYVNVFIGPAELALIPEGYEPKHWEYYRHPITRFIAQYVIVSPQERYERNLNNLFNMKEVSLIKQLKLKVREKMKEKQDYQSWYYEVPPYKYPRKYVADDKKFQKEKASEYGFIKD